MSRSAEANQTAGGRIFPAGGWGGLTVLWHHVFKVVGFPWTLFAWWLYAPSPQSLWIYSTFTVHADLVTCACVCSWCGCVSWGCLAYSIMLYAFWEMLQTRRNTVMDKYLGGLIFLLPWIHQVKYQLLVSKKKKLNWYLAGLRHAHIFSQREQ